LESETQLKYLVHKKTSLLPPSGTHTKIGAKWRFCPCKEPASYGAHPGLPAQSTSTAHERALAPLHCTVSHALTFVFHFDRDELVPFVQTRGVAGSMRHPRLAPLFAAQGMSLCSPHWPGLGHHLHLRSWRRICRRGSRCTCENTWSVARAPRLKDSPAESTLVSFSTSNSVSSDSTTWPRNYFSREGEGAGSQLSIYVVRVDREDKGNERASIGGSYGEWICGGAMVNERWLHVWGQEEDLWISGPGASGDSLASVDGTLSGDFVFASLSGDSNVWTRALR
jgi:hypothetical protein